MMCVYVYVCACMRVVCWYHECVCRVTFNILYDIIIFMQVKNSSQDAPFIETSTVRVKLTGDGTNIGKRLHVMNFAFTLLDEGHKADTSSRNHCIAIYKETENYESMKRCSRGCVDETNHD